MSAWPSIKSNRLLTVLKRKGWEEVRQSGSHKFLRHPVTNKTFTFAFHQGDEIGPKLLAKIAKQTDLKPEDV